MILDDVSAWLRPLHRARQFKPGCVILLGAATAMCIAVSLVSFRYLLPGLPAPAPLPNLSLDRPLLILHAIFAATALQLVPLQLWTAGSGKAGSFHRVSGYAAVVAICVAALAGLWIAPTARGGIITSFGFATLAAVWLVGVTMGFISARRKAYKIHGR